MGEANMTDAVVEYAGVDRHSIKFRVHLTDNPNKVITFAVPLTSLLCGADPEGMMNASIKTAVEKLKR
jgi:hypothetical protein